MASASDSAAIAGGSEQPPPELPASLFRRTPSRRRSSSRTRPLAPPLPVDEDDDPAFPKRFSASRTNSSTSSAVLANANSTEEQNRLLYAMEAEEEALVNSLSRKLEKLRAEKIALESTLEMEQEQLVNRLQRQLSQLLAQQQATESSSPSTFSLPSSPVTRDLPLDPQSHLGPRARVGSASAPYVYSPPLGSSQAMSFPPPANLSALLSQPSAETSAASAGGAEAFDPNIASTLLRALQSENTTLRTRLADAQSDADKQSRLSQSYRSELLHLRRSAGLDVADLLAGLPEEGSTSTSLPSARASASIRIPGAAQSPVRSRSESKSLYSPASASFSPDTAFSGAASTSLSSASVSLAPSRSGTSAATTPSVSYTTPTVPASTPVHPALGLPSMMEDTDSGVSTPFGSSTSSSSLNTSVAPSRGGGGGFQHRPPAYKVPPPSLASSLGSTSGFPQAVSPYALSTSPIPEVAAESETLSTISTEGVRGGREDLQRRLSNSRNGASVAETGFIPDRRGMRRTSSSAGGSVQAEK